MAKVSGKCRIATVDNERTLPGNSPDQMMELPLDGRKIGIDIRMIIFEIVQDQCARAVMDELGPLVEKRRVVLIGLDHEERRSSQPSRLTEIARHTADEETRRHPR